MVPLQIGQDRGPLVPLAHWACQVCGRSGTAAVVETGWGGGVGPMGRMGLMGAGRGRQGALRLGREVGRR
jgi:hypothetical protein